MLKNINKELQTTQGSLLKLYEDAKKFKKSDFLKRKRDAVSDENNDEYNYENDEDVNSDDDDENNGNDNENQDNYENISKEAEAASLFTNKNILDFNIWNNFNGSQLMLMLPQWLVNEASEAYRKIDTCEYDLKTSKQKIL